MRIDSSIIGMTGAEAVVETLKLLGVERVFGLPGVQNIELFDALADAPFSTFTPTNESAAVFMADAHARVTGKIGVVVVTAGPGLTNALTGIAEAHLDSSPVLVLVSASGEMTGKFFQLHQISQGDVVKPLVKGFFKPAGSKKSRKLSRTQQNWRAKVNPDQWWSKSAQHCSWEDSFFTACRFAFAHIGRHRHPIGCRRWEIAEL